MSDRTAPAQADYVISRIEERKRYPCPARSGRTGPPAARPGRRGRPRSGWDSITPIEHSVADLVAEGLSNPQIGGRLFISSRTVQSHLAHVFAKLDISTRAQLAVEVTRRKPA